MLRERRDQRHQWGVRQIDLAGESRHDEIAALIHLPRHAEIRRVVEFPRIVAGEPERDPYERQQQQSRLFPGAIGIGFLLRGRIRCAGWADARRWHARKNGVWRASPQRKRQPKLPLSQHPSGIVTNQADGVAVLLP